MSSKNPLIIDGRLSMYNEHVDDTQVEYTPLHVITEGPDILDHINRMILIIVDFVKGTTICA
jgi:hypothetical protein